MFKLNKDFMLGAAVGFGAGFFTASSGFLQKGNYKAGLKDMMKAGLVGFENSREAVASFRETVEDLFSEARSEVRAEQVGDSTHPEPVEKSERAASSGSDVASQQNAASNDQQTLN